MSLSRLALVFVVLSVAAIGWATTGPSAAAETVEAYACGVGAGGNTLTVNGVAESNPADTTGWVFKIDMNGTVSTEPFSNTVSLGPYDSFDSSGFIDLVVVVVEAYGTDKETVHEELVRGYFGREGSNCDTFASVQASCVDGVAQIDYYLKAQAWEIALDRTFDFNLEEAPFTVFESTDDGFSNPLDGTIGWPVAQGDAVVTSLGYGELGTFSGTRRIDYPNCDSPPAPPSCRGEVATIWGTDAGETLIGTDGDDVIVGLGGADTIYGNGGADVICAGPGPDTVFGGTGRDKIYGQNGADTLYGNSGADRIEGGLKPDTIKGGNGNDKLFGGRGGDTLRGGNQADTLFGNAGTDRLGGDGGSPDVCNGGVATDTHIGGCETIISIP